MASDNEEDGEGEEYEEEFGEEAMGESNESGDDDGVNSSDEDESEEESGEERRGARNVRGDPGMTRRGRVGETREMERTRTERKGAEAPDERWALGHVTSEPRENLELGT